MWADKHKFASDRCAGTSGKICFGSSPKGSASMARNACSACVAEHAFYDMRSPPPAHDSAVTAVTHWQYTRGSLINDLGIQARPKSRPCSRPDPVTGRLLHISSRCLATKQIGKRSDAMEFSDLPKSLAMLQSSLQKYVFGWLAELLSCRH